jgi:hypothetical protein
MEESKREIISPKSEKQYRFINSEADCTVFGGEFCAS